MSRYSFKSLVSFFGIAIILGILVLLNFFHAVIESYIPVAPDYFIPVFSAGVISLIFFFLWQVDLEEEKSKQEFITIITHKFRTPLTSIKWAIETLRNDITIQQKEDILVQMENSDQRIMEIVDLVVGFSQFNKNLAYAYEATSLREIIDESLHKFAVQIREKKITFHISSAESMPMVVTDKRKIQFVVDMLIDNAIKYSLESGAITINFTRDKKFLILSVSDNGIGVSRRDRSYIFKSFYRSHDARLAYTEGMGLGLYTAKAIVKKHHGKIWFNSKGVGKGSTFYLALRIKE